MTFPRSDSDMRRIAQQVAQETGYNSPDLLADAVGERLAPDDDAVRPDLREWALRVIYDAMYCRGAG